MRVEREIAGFAFPFAAGVMAAVLSGGSPCIIKPTYHTLSLAMTLLPVIMLLHHDRRSWDPRVQWGLIVICALSCGIFIGISGAELQVSVLQAEGWLSAAAEKAGRGMGALIDSMAFDDSQTNGIIKALLTGDRTGISSETAEGFRNSGASHILALSGLHLGIIYGIISRLLSIAGKSRTARVIKSMLTMLACGAYTLATGAGASITRAYIFIAVKETAEMAGRTVSLKGVLAASIMLHLAFNPTAAADIGFQLSYAAMFGIAFIYPVLKKMWRNKWMGLKWIWESAALSISCQITTGPLAWHYFGTFPQYFLLTNLIALPLAGIIIPSALLAVTLTAIGCCPDAIIYITEWLTQALRHSLEVISTM